MNNIQLYESTRSIHLLAILTSTWNSKKEPKEKEYTRYTWFTQNMGYIHGKVCLLYYLQKSPILQYEPSPHAFHTIQYPENIQEQIDTKTYIITLSYKMCNYEWIPHLSYIVRDLKDITYHNQCGINDFTFIYIHLIK